MKTTPMACLTACLALLLPAAALGRAADSNRAFLAGGLQPEAVAQTLARVEDEWRSQAAVFAEDAAGQGKTSKQSFSKSCTTVVDAIVQGSSGDQNKVREYMSLVCGQKSLTAWHRDRCTDLKQAMEGSLQFNAYANRAHFSATKLCGSFWSTFTFSEQKRVEAERVAQKEMLIKANEQAKVLAEQKRKDEVRRQAEKEHQEAVEKKEQAEKAKKDTAARLAQKKAEAEAMAVAAQAKVKKAALEAAKAAEEHRQLAIEHEQAEARLKQITLDHQKAAAKELQEHQKDLQKADAAKTAVKAEAAPKKATPEVVKTEAKPEVVKKAAKPEAVVAKPVSSIILPSHDAVKPAAKTGIIVPMVRAAIQAKAEKATAKASVPVAKAAAVKKA